MRQDIGNDTTMTPREADDFCSDIVPGPEMALNIGFPIQAAFAQLEGYARNLAAQSDDPHCKMQLERVRTAALDLAASITSEMLTSPTGHTLKEATRRTNQPALIDPSQLEALLHPSRMVRRLRSAHGARHARRRRPPRRAGANQASLRVGRTHRAQRTRGPRRDPSCGTRSMEYPRLPASRGSRCTSRPPGAGARRGRRHGAGCARPHRKCS